MPMKVIEILNEWDGIAAGLVEVDGSVYAFNCFADPSYPQSDKRRTYTYYDERGTALGTFTEDEIVVEEPA